MLPMWGEKRERKSSSQLASIDPLILFLGLHSIPWSNKNQVGWITVGSEAIGNKMKGSSQYDATVNIIEKSNSQQTQKDQIWSEKKNK